MCKKSILLLALLLVPVIFFGQKKDKGNNTSFDYYLEGVNQYNIQNYSDAESLLLQSLKLDTQNDASCYYLGLIYDSQGLSDKSELYLKRACELAPGSYWYRLSLARFYAKSQRIDQALSLFEKISQDFPSQSSIYYEIIDLYTGSGQIEKALSTLDTIEALRGANEATVNARYELLVMQNKYDEAAEYLLSIDEEYPSPRTSFILGDIYKSRYNDSAAIKYYNKSLSMDPHYYPSYFGLAEVYRMKRQFNLFFQNINVFLSSPEMNSSMEANYMKEVVFTPQFVQAFLPQVDTMITTFVGAHPTDSTALFLAGSYYVQTGRMEEGKEFYHEVLNIYPDDKHSHLEYISLLYYLKDWKELISQVETTLSVFPQDLSLMEVLAVAYWQAGDTDGSIATYSKMIKSSPKGSPLLLSGYTALGDLYQTKGNMKKTMDCYDKALKINPDYYPLLNNYAYFLSQQGKQLKKALQMSKKTIKAEPDNSTYLDTYAWLLYLTGDYQDAKDYFKHAMLYGGTDSAVILDHYADVLFAIKEYDLANMYWEKADKVDPSLGIKDKMLRKRGEITK